MKKKTYRLLAGLWILALIATRVIYYIYSGQTVIDAYDYYAHAMIKADQLSPVLESGMAYSYIWNLSGILAFVGNRMELLGIYQLLLQILWMVMLFLGVGLIFGRIAQMLTGTILASSPWILGSIFIISPENYFMFFFSLLLFLLGLFVSVSKKDSTLWGAALALVSFGMGVICVWNYLGWLLLPLAVYALAKNRERFFHLVVLVLGLVLGVCATLLKYTRLTGFSLWEQFSWWIAPLKALPERCQGLSIQMAMWLIFAGMTGVLIAVIAESMKHRKIHNVQDADLEEAVQESEPAAEAEPVPEEEPVNYTVTEDGRKIALLDNPLPLPKKHEKRKMEFKYNELPGETVRTIKEWEDQTVDGQVFDDFDITISENDDFDV